MIATAMTATAMIATAMIATGVARMTTEMGPGSTRTVQTIVAATTLRRWASVVGWQPTNRSRVGKSRAMRASTSTTSGPGFPAGRIRMRRWFLTMVAAAMVFPALSATAGQAASAAPAKKAATGRPAQGGAPALGRQFLQALKTSDMDTVDRLAVPETATWIRRSLSVVHGYTVVRDTPCQETIAMSDAQPLLQNLFGAQKRFDEEMKAPLTQKPPAGSDAYGDLTKARDQLKSAYPCLGKLLNAPSPLVAKDAWSALDGRIVVRVHETVVDIDVPAPAGRPTRERRQLWLGSLEGGAASRSWKVIGLNPFHPS
jgi:hypothetical protein